jgi:HD superfamily phosphohydrolase
VLTDAHDRLYGRLRLPEVARRLAGTCPLLLRLREVRMPNIPFASYPSFANVSRYEHSLGVAHLAWWWARRNGLNDERGEALVLASLYHDAATPAFSHLFEEFLSRDNFHHESALADVLSGRPSLVGGAQAQVFLGRHPRLRDELAARDSDQPLMTATGIAALAVGKEPLGVALHGDLDLDNIDNVIRATTAMGLYSEMSQPPVHPYEVAESLIWHDGQVTLARDASDAVQRWKAMRRRLYSAILDNQTEFVAQATIKWALDACYEYDPALSEKNAWTLTEPELVFLHLLRNPTSKKLMDKVRGGPLPELLFSAWISDLTPLLTSGSAAVTDKLCAALSEAWRTDVYVSFNVDKREREIRLPPAPERTLFDLVPDANDRAPNGVPAAAGKPGVLGAVGARVHDVRGRSGRPDPGEALAATRAALEDAFGPAVDALDTAWLGLRR